MDVNIVNVILIGILVVVTGFYAWQTHRQVNLLNRQLQGMAEQRRRSIVPALQVKRISYWYQVSEISPSTHKKANTPGLELYVTNVGPGPALDLKITAAATIRVTRGDSQEGTWCHLIWGMMEVAQEYYLDNTIDHVRYRLNLHQVEKDTHRERDRKIHIRLNYRDIDNNPLTELKFIELGSDMATLRYSDDETKVIPGDDDFPDNPLIVV